MRKIPIPKNLVIQGLTDQENFQPENLDPTLKSFWRMTNLFLILQYYDLQKNELKRCKISI
jgi:hypothetical protein